jgi:hypothetical protein
LTYLLKNSGVRNPFQKRGNAAKPNEQNNFLLVHKIMSETQNQEQGPKGQTIIINQPASASNGVGTAGFVLALVAALLGWIPVLGWILWIIGLILSFVGVLLKKPRGLAIAGLVISVVDFILLLSVFASLSYISKQF